MHAMQMYCDNRREPKVGMLCEGVLMGCWGVCNRNQHLWPIDEVVMGGEGRKWRFPKYCDENVNYQLAFSSGMLHLSRGEIAMRVRTYVLVRLLFKVG